MNGQRPTATRPPRLSLPVAIIGFAGAVALALVLIALILATDPGRAAAVPLASSSASPTLSAPATESPSATPIATAVDVSTPRPPIASPTPPTASAAPSSSAFRLSAAATNLRYPLTAAGPDGGIYVLFNGEAGAVIGLLDRDGDVRPGWPVRLNSPWCSQLLVAPDQSVRARCDLQDIPDSRLFALDRTGRALRGWPVDLTVNRVGRPASDRAMVGWAVDAAGMAGSDVVAFVRTHTGDEPPAGYVSSVALVIVSEDGRVARGYDALLPEECCSTVSMGPDGTAFFTTLRYGSRGARTDIRELDMRGLGADSWPATLEGRASSPAFTREGNVVMAVGNDDLNERGGQLIVLDPGGNVLPASVDDLPMTLSSPWTGAGDAFPGRPVVGGGTTYVVGGADGTEVVATDGRGDVMPGWPYRSALAMEDRTGCNAPDTGCGFFVVDPAANAQGLFLALEATGSTRGGSLVALTSRGAIRAGWPVTLKQAGAFFTQVTADPAGGAWAMAVEPEANGESATLLSIAADSTIRWKATLVAP